MKDFASHFDGQLLKNIHSATMDTKKHQGHKRIAFEETISCSPCFFVFVVA